MPNLNAKKLGLTLGSLFALWYVIWALVLTLGGQDLLDWIIKIHLINMSISPAFTLTNAIMGLIYHFVIGYVFGYLLAWVFNKFCK